MIVLDFQLDEDVADELGGRSPAEVRPDSLLVTCFETPVRFCIDNVELMARTPRVPPSPVVGKDWVTVPPQEDSRYTPVPLLGFAVGLHQAAISTRPNMSWFHVECFRFRFVPGDVVEIEYGEGKVIAVQREELRRASTDFLIRARDALLAKLPALANHASWLQWFPSDLRPNGTGQ